MAHMDRISMGDIHGVHDIRFQARAPDLVLPPRETPRRYGYASMAQKRLSELLYAHKRLKCLCLSIPKHT